MRSLGSIRARVEWLASACLLSPETLIVHPRCVTPRKSVSKSLANRAEIRDFVRDSKLVRKGGLEPPRYCYRQPLKLVRLPIPPLSRGG